MKIRHLLACTAWLLAYCVTPAFAGAPLNDQPNWIIALFDGADPVGVTVDVVEVGSGTTVGDDLAAIELDSDSTTSIYWRFDLTQVNDYPTGCELKTYAMAFQPTTGDCSRFGTPANCRYAVVEVGGASCFADAISTHYVHTSTVVSGQGIDQAVLDFYNARSVLPLLWVEIDRSDDYDYTAPDSTYYEVYFYTSSASAPRVLCTVKTNVDPASALPSYTHCS